MDQNEKKTKFPLESLKTDDFIEKYEFPDKDSYKKGRFINTAQADSLKRNDFKYSQSYDGTQKKNKIFTEKPEGTYFLEKEEPKKRYNEKIETEKFLKSNEGLLFLIDKTRNFKFDSKQNIILQIDNLIDFYTTWTVSFPVKKNLKMSKYEFIKSVEDFCCDNNKEDINKLV